VRLFCFSSHLLKIVKLFWTFVPHTRLRSFWSYTGRLFGHLDGLPHTTVRPHSYTWVPRFYVLLQLTVIVVAFSPAALLPFGRWLFCGCVLPFWTRLRFRTVLFSRFGCFPFRHVLLLLLRFRFDTTHGLPHITGSTYSLPTGYRAHTHTNALHFAWFIC